MTTDFGTRGRRRDANRPLRGEGRPDVMEKTAERRRARPPEPGRDGGARGDGGATTSVRPGSGRSVPPGPNPRAVGAMGRRGTVPAARSPLARPIPRQRARSAPSATVPGRVVPTVAPGLTTGTVPVRRPRTSAWPPGSAPRDNVVRGVPRMPFVLLVLALLGGGLICLLVINTTLGAASFRISQLQKTGASLSTQEQSLQEHVAAEEAPGEIAKRAYQLGMRVQPSTQIVDLGTHQTYVLPGQVGVDANLGASPASSASPAQPGTSTMTATGTPTPTPTAMPTGTSSQAATQPPAGQTATAARSSP